MPNPVCRIYRQRGMESGRDRHEKATTIEDDVSEGGGRHDMGCVVA